MDTVRSAEPLLIEYPYENAGVHDTIIPEKEITTVSLQEISPRMLLEKPEHLNNGLIYTVLFLILFAVIRLRGQNFLSLLSDLVINRSKTEVALNEGVVPHLLYYISGLLLSFSAVAIAIVLVTTHTFDLFIALHVFGGLLIWHFSYLCIMRITGWLFDLKNLTEEAMINLWAFHIMGGLILSPVIMASFFMQTSALNILIITVIVYFHLFYLLQFTRWVKILLAHKVSIFYMFLYLCALELVPFLILYKSLV